MIELPQDFRDLLIELHDAGAAFVIVDGHAVAAGENFQLEGRAIPVIGLTALIKNKIASGRDQDRADVKALEATTKR